jgi:PadR family transcriptional regulator PadR
MEGLENWKTQIRKGYLELCLLALIRRHKRLYGFDLLDRLRELELEMKEGTLYPMLSRMTTDGLLRASWETENVKGHPRKFYSLTPVGERLFEGMTDEFERMVAALRRARKEKE